MNTLGMTELDPNEKIPSSVIQHRLDSPAGPSFLKVDSINSAKGYEMTVMAAPTPSASDFSFAPEAATPMSAQPFSMSASDFSFAPEAATPMSRMVGAPM
jgi:hypothetical protein